VVPALADLMIAVIGCGNLNRSDDGVGIEVVRALKAMDGLKLLDAGTDGMAVMFGARGCATLIVIDSCSTGSEPGSIFEVPGGELAQVHEASINLHGFRWDNALFAGKKIFREQFPSDVVVLLIEGRSFELNIGLCPEVAEARDKVTARVEALIAERKKDALIAERLP
jgi:hydrogenase maturation protease